MTQYDENNRGVGFVNNAHVGKINFNGTEYRLVLVKAGENAKIAFDMIIYNRDTCEKSALFDNDKQGNENRPDYTGSINGYWVSAWEKTSAKGNKFMSISVKPKDDSGYNQSNNQADDFDDFGDSVPF